MAFGFAAPRPQDIQNPDSFKTAIDEVVKAMNANRKHRPLANQRIAAWGIELIAGHSEDKCHGQTPFRWQRVKRQSRSDTPEIAIIASNWRSRIKGGSIKQP
jgi:hypothetical protein